MMALYMCFATGEECQSVIRPVSAALSLSGGEHTSPRPTDQQAETTHSCSGKRLWVSHRGSGKLVKHSIMNLQK